MSINRSKSDRKTEWFESETLGERYCRITHPGRPELYVFPKDMSNTYALTAFRYGSFDNRFRPRGEGEFVCVPDGVAHFLEHKMFTGEDGSDTMEKFAALGAEVNAYTSFDRTVYLFGTTDRFDEAYRELLRMVTRPYFTEETVKKEQGIIAQEIKMYDDDPEDVCFFNLLRAMYSVLPIKVNVCGTVASISRITPEILYDCHKSFYNSSNMVSIVCGRVDPEEVADILCAEIPAEERVELERYQYDEPVELHLSCTTAFKQASKPVFGIGIKDTKTGLDAAARRKKRILMSIINRMLFASSSELYNSLYDEELITSPLSYTYEAAEDYSFVTILGASEQPDEVLERVKNHIAALCDGGVSEADFERCRRVRMSDIIGRYDSTEDIANSMIDCAFWGLDVFEDSKIAARLTVSDVNELLRDFYRQEQIAMSVVFPLETKR